MEKVTRHVIFNTVFQRAPKLEPKQAGTGPCQESQFLVVPAQLAAIAAPLFSSDHTSFVPRYSTLPLVLTIK